MMQGSTEYLAQCGTDDLQMRTINAYGAGALSRYNCQRASKRDTGQVVLELPSTPMGLALFPGKTATEHQRGAQDRSSLNLLFLGMDGSLIHSYTHSG
jgi:hypothetical protein